MSDEIVPLILKEGWTLPTRTKWFNCAACGKKYQPVAMVYDHYSEPGWVLRGWKCDCGIFLEEGHEWPFVEQEACPEHFEKIGFVVVDYETTSQGILRQERKKMAWDKDDYLTYLQRAADFMFGGQFTAGLTQNERGDYIHTFKHKSNPKISLSFLTPDDFFDDETAEGLINYAVGLIDSVSNQLSYLLRTGACDHEVVNGNK